MRGARSSRAGLGLAARLARELERSAILDPVAPVVVALSGGLDSVVLLHLLRFPLSDRVGRLSAAHLDHRMRTGSRADAGWVAGLCRAWRVPLVMERAEPPPRSEAEARRVRYAFLENVAPSGACVVTAHHADDQAETVLFRLARGTGVGGLRGIAPRRGRIVRPLLPFTRAELEEYALARRLGYRTDPTNVDLRYARNRIRHQVIPALERIRPGVASRMAHLAQDARRAEAAWEQAVEAVAAHVIVEADASTVTLARDLLRSYHPHLRARLLRHLLRRYGTAPGRAGTHAALEFINSGPSGAGLDLPAGLRLERDFDHVRIVAPVAAEATDAADRPVQIPGPRPGSGRAVVGGRTLEVRWGPGAAGGETISVPAPAYPLLLRRWRPGDRIRFDYGSKKLKKLLGERRLDRRARERVPVLVDRQGEVLWAVGIARARGVGVGGDGEDFLIAVSDVGDA